MNYPRKSSGAEPEGEATIENGVSFGERSEPKEKPQREPDVTDPRKSEELSVETRFPRYRSLW